MTTIILLDSGLLGLVTNPRISAEVLAATNWLWGLVRGGVRVVIPEITDYELRRELLRADKMAGLRRLDHLIDDLEYLPLTTGMMRQAAVFWAHARRRGRPTAPAGDLDGDMILAAQAVSLTGIADEVIVASTNVRRLALFVDARHWHDIR